MFFYRLLYISFLFLGISSFGIGQEKDNFQELFWGDTQRLRSSVVSLSATPNNNILCVQTTTSFLRTLSRNKSGFSFSYIQNYQIPKVKPTKFKGSGNKTRLMDYTFLGDFVLGISYHNPSFSSYSSLFYHLINPETKEKSNFGFPLFEASSKITPSDWADFITVSSQNADYAGMLYIPKTFPDEPTLLKSAVFSEDFSPPSKNEFLFPYSSLGFNALEYLVSNRQEQILICGHFPYKTVPKGKKNSWFYYDYLTITKINGSSIYTEVFNLAGLQFSNIKVIEQAQGIIVSGIYVAHIDNNVQGFFWLEINNQGKIVRQETTPFPEGFYTSTKDFESKNYPNPKQNEVEYSFFDIIEFQKTEEGYFLLAEYTAKEYRLGGTQLPGATNVIDTYYWSGDLLVVKIDAEGKLLWSEVVPKLQRTVNDGGYFLSVARFWDNEFLHLFFNDSKENYSKEGAFIRWKNDVSFAKFSGHKNTIAHVSVNLKDGAIHRHSVLGKAETKVTLVPQLFVAFPQSKELMIYGRGGKKQRLGNVNFGE